MEKTPPENLPSRSTSKSPSWNAERDALRRIGDRKTRAILAIFHARRSARRPEFFVHPDIAECWELNPQDLNWALTRLEGVLVETIDSKSGRYRTLRLLPQFEDTVLISSNNSHREKRHFTSGAHNEERVEIDTAAVMARLAAERTA